MLRILLACTAIAAPAVAQDQPHCAPRAALAAGLAMSPDAGGYGENVIGMGIKNDGSLTELFVNSETGTWSVTVTTPAGMACMIASGSMWQGGSVVPQGDPT